MHTSLGFRVDGVSTGRHQQNVRPLNIEHIDKSINYTEGQVDAVKTSCLIYPETRQYLQVGICEQLTCVCRSLQSNCLRSITVRATTFWAARQVNCCAVMMSKMCISDPTHDEINSCSIFPTTADFGPQNAARCHCRIEENKVHIDLPLVFVLLESLRSLGHRVIGV